MSHNYIAVRSLPYQTHDYIYYHIPFVQSFCRERSTFTSCCSALSDLRQRLKAAVDIDDTPLPQAAQQQSVKICVEYVALCARSKPRTPRNVAYEPVWPSGKALGW